MKIFGVYLFYAPSFIRAEYRRRNGGRGSGADVSARPAASAGPENGEPRPRIATE